MSATPRIEIAIDELVLHGVPAEHADAVLAAVRARLGELASTGWTGPLVERAESSRRLPEISVAAGAPLALGRSVADAVWANLSPPATRTGGAP